MRSAFCTSCGARLDPAGRFCASCGKPVWGDAAKVAGADGDTHDQPSPAAAVARPPSRKMSRRVIVAAGGVAVIGIALAVASSQWPGTTGLPGATALHTTAPATSSASPDVSTKAPVNTTSTGGIVHGPGFDVSIPAGYIVTTDGTDGGNFQATLGGAPSTPSFVIVSREPFAGSLVKAVDHWQTVNWKGVATLDLGPANLSGAGAVGRHMIITGTHPR